MRFFGFGKSKEEQELKTKENVADESHNRSTIKVGQIENKQDYKCRICLGLGDNDEEMCTPCQCTGSVKYIHVTCLKEWIKEKRSVKCELCGQNYSKKWVKWA